MTLPDNLPALLRDAGLEVIEVGDWRKNGRPGPFNPVGQLNHHTAAGAKTWTRAKRTEYARWMFYVGRSDLPAPLVQGAIGPDGEIYIGAAGRANHAGTAKASGSVGSGDGNAIYTGWEWMLSGYEPIPAKMMQAAITANAVVSHLVTKTTVKTLSCHYNTSVTGKWDIGDPNGVDYKGAKVLDIAKFRTAVAARKEDLYYSEPPEPNHVDITVRHASMRFDKTIKEWEHDLDAIFDAKPWWVTGTEAGEKANFQAVRRVAKRHGYAVARTRSNWLAINKSKAKPGTITFSGRVIVDNDRVFGPGHDTAIVKGSFVPRNERIGPKITILGTHYPTKGRPSANTALYKKNLWVNKKMGQVIGNIAKRDGDGDKLFFVGADTNIIDKADDVFFGSPLTTCWDEIKKWPNTGHGNIDVIASYDKDGRVSCLKKGTRAYSDKAMFLHTDHFLIQAKYRVALLDRKAA